MSSGTAPNQAALPQELSRFRVITNPFLGWSLRILPWLGPPAAIAILVLLGDVMFSTGVLTAAISLYTFGVLMSQIPKTLSAAWNQQLITSRNTSRESALDEQKLKSEFGAFVSRFQFWLNNVMAQLLFGTFFALIPVGYTVYPLHLLDPHLFSPHAVLFLLLPELLPQCFVGFVLGTMVWRMGVTAFIVMRLGRDFSLLPKLGHPDGCAGFKPIGDLCFLSAIIILEPAVFLGGWMILLITGIAQCSASGPAPPLCVPPYLPQYISVFSILLIIPIIATPVTFLAPVLTIHGAMVSRKNDLQARLNEITIEIDKLTSKMVVGAKTIEDERIAQELDVKRDAYLQIKSFPTWPFNLWTVGRLVAGYAVSIVGFMSSVSSLVKGGP